MKRKKKQFEMFNRKKNILIAQICVSFIVAKVFRDFSHSFQMP